MNLDEHAIWDLPVNGAAADASVPPTSTPARPRNGRLYRTAGAEAHPEAVVAMPETTPRVEAPVEQTPLAEAPPIIAPPVAVPLIAEPEVAPPNPATDELLDRLVRETGAPEAPRTQAGPPADWFQDPVADEPVLAAETTASPITPAPTAEPKLAGVARRLNTGTFGTRRIGLYLFAVTAAVAVADALLTGSIGIVTGVALIAITAFAAARVERDAAWSTMVLPSYMLIAAVLVGGQFATTSPGASITGQALLVVTSLISLAPWLAIATAIGAVLPRMRFR